MIEGNGAQQSPVRSTQDRSIACRGSVRGPHRRRSRCKIEWNSHAHRDGSNYVALLKERVSDADRAEYLAYPAAKEAQSLKVSSITTVACNLYKLDKLTMGAP